MNFKDGIYDNISNEDYHADRDYISSSALKLFPYKKDEYIAKYQNSLAPQPTSKALLIGTAAHMRILEPLKFYHHYTKTPFDLNKVKEKTRWNDLQNKAKDRNQIILTHEQDELITNMKFSVDNHPVAGVLLKDAKIEQSFFLEHDGLKQKVRPDAIKGDIIIELKTIDNIKNFPDNIVKYGYNFSSMMYHTIISENKQHSMDFVFIVVQKEYPFTCIVKRLGSTLQGHGYKAYEEAKESYKRIQETGEWELVQDVLPPKWFTYNFKEGV